MLLAGSFYFLLVLRSYTPPIDNLLMVVFASIIAYAIIKYHLMDIRVAITRAGIFLVLYTLVLGLPFYVGYKTHSWVLSASIAFILATIGPAIYRLLQKKAENLLLAKQRRYQHLLLTAARGMSQEHNLEHLLKLIVYIIRRVVNINFSALYLYNPEYKVYALEASRSYKIPLEGSDIPGGSAVIEYIKNAPSAFIPEQMPKPLCQTLNKALGTPFGLIIPAVMEG